jgi:hypothetical protein
MRSDMRELGGEVQGFAKCGGVDGTIPEESQRNAVTSPVLCGQRRADRDRKARADDGSLTDASDREVGQVH